MNKMLLFSYIVFNIGLISNTRQLDPDFNKWKSTLLKATAKECVNIPKDRESKTTKLDSSICINITKILNGISTSKREKLYKILQKNYL